MSSARPAPSTFTSGRKPAARVLRLVASPVVRSFVVFALAAAAGCGGGEGGWKANCVRYSIPFMGSVNCCPVTWTRDVPAAATVALMDMQYTTEDCNLTVETVCVAGNCSGVRVSVGRRDVTVPSVTQFENFPVPQVYVRNDGTSAVRVTVAISGWCMAEQCV